MTTTTVDNSEVQRRTIKIGKKFLLGYMPCTGLVIALAWAWAITKSASGPAAIAGALILAVWSIQICIFNLLILLVRFTSYTKFIGQAALITVFSVVLFPSGVFLTHQVGLVLMGEPNLAKYLQENSTDDCTLVQILKENRINERVRTTQATVQCGAAKTKKTCEWYFEYQKEKGVWAGPHSPSCK